MASGGLSDRGDRSRLGFAGAITAAPARASSVGCARPRRQRESRHGIDNGSGQGGVGIDVPHSAAVGDDPLRELIDHVDAMPQADPARLARRRPGQRRPAVVAAPDRT